MGRLNHVAALTIVALAAGCNVIDTGPVKGKGTLYTETEEGRVYDAGALPVGTPSIVYVTLTADQYDVELQTISITAVNSQKAFYTLEEWKNLQGSLPDEITNGDVVLGPKKVTVDTQTTGFEYPFVFFAGDEAWSQAEIAFNSNARNAKAVQKIRAHASISTFAIYPSTVDFGWAPLGGLATGEVVIRNDGDLPLVVAVGDHPDQVAALEADEVVVGGGETKRYKLQYTPRTEDPWSDTMAFVSGTEEGATTLAVINLRANDCEHGVPEAYDKDEDGWTTCAGDCDDAHDSVYPGAKEIADGLDNDCNDEVDDQTAGYDDDGDGYCDHATSCFGDDLLPGDCNDFDPDIHPPPGTSEAGCPNDENPLCSDGIDNDCDGTTDGGSSDVDGDGYTEEGGDCDDTNGAVGPNRPELPDALDNDCDDVIDEGTVLFDDDGDGYCEGISPLPPLVKPNTCSNTESTAHFGDCNDDPDNYGVYVFPGAAEATADPSVRAGYFGIDNNCDPLHKIDEGTFWADDDNDGSTEEGGDCDDADPAVGPAIWEVPGNGKDDDCNPATPASGPQ